MLSIIKEMDRDEYMKNRVHICTKNREIKKLILNSKKYKLIFTHSTVYFSPSYFVVNNFHQKILYNLNKRKKKIMTGNCVICNIDASLKCQGCQAVTYCGVEHQKNHWKSHKIECKPYEVIFRCINFHSILIKLFRFHPRRN